MKTYFLLALLSFSGGLSASSSSSHNNNNNNDDEILNNFKTALNIIHSNIEALRRDRRGNPKHNLAILIDDYETLSTIIQSLPYYLSNSRALAQLQNYKPRVTHYRSETTLDKAQKHAFEKINRGIKLIRAKHGSIQPLFGDLQRTLDLINTDLKIDNVDPKIRQRVAKHKITAQAHIKKMKPSWQLSIHNFYEQISREEAEQQFKKSLGKNNKRARSQGPLDKYTIQKNNNDDNSENNKKQKTLGTVPTITNGAAPEKNEMQEYKVPK